MIKTPLGLLTIHINGTKTIYNNIKQPHQVLRSNNTIVVDERYLITLDKTKLQAGDIIKIKIDGIKRYDEFETGRNQLRNQRAD